jgi:hypothetical protein
MPSSSREFSDFTDRHLTCDAPPSILTEPTRRRLPVGCDKFALRVEDRLRCFSNCRNRVIAR